MAHVYGEVTKEAVPISEFIVEEDAKPLLEHSLRSPEASKNKDIPEKSEWTVGIKWLKGLSRENAKTFKGVFANQNIVCKLRDTKTLEFLQSELVPAEQ